MKCIFYVVLLNTLSPENAGAVARLMGNYELHKLIFINPVWTDIERAKLTAHTPLGIEIINQREIFSSLSEACNIINFHEIIGFTRRSGKYREIFTDCRSYFTGFFQHIKSISMNIALVFGNEDTGISDDESRYCNNLIYIPTSNQSPSLNLSHAAAIVFNEIFGHIHLQRQKRSSNLSIDITGRFTPATYAEKNDFFMTIMQAAGRKKLFIKNDERTLRRLFERIFSSPLISKKDLDHLQALLLRFLFADFRENDPSV